MSFEKDTLAGVALCRLRFCPDLLLPFLWVTEADKRSSSGTEFSCWGLCALWWRCGGELLLVWPPVSDMLACPDDRFSSDELLPVHSGRLWKSYRCFTARYLKIARQATSVTTITDEISRVCRTDQKQGSHTSFSTVRIFFNRTEILDVPEGRGFRANWGDDAVSDEDAEALALEPRCPCPFPPPCEPYCEHRFSVNSPRSLSSTEDNIDLVHCHRPVCKREK